MCGIAGIAHLDTGAPASVEHVRRMTEALVHRGPDGAGYAVRGSVGLGHRRLAILDLAGGAQPIYNEDRSISVVFNGEIFNYVELRAELVARGHTFTTKSDTEVLVHLYEERGLAFVDALNGQFAIALRDDRAQRLVLVRDRPGICPLFWATLPHGGIAFASEMKALFRHPDVRPELDPGGVEQVLTLWSNVPPRTVFRGVFELPPGCLMTVAREGCATRRYWGFRFPDARGHEERPVSEWTSRVEETLSDAVRIRLRADVPVGAYLSGGLDSSLVAALVRRDHANRLKTFSVGFEDAAFDERAWQRTMAERLGTEHHSVTVAGRDIGATFADVVRHAEKPLTRTAPAPLFRLSALVREQGFRVVLTGEGADEVFGGYDIFKEDRVRRFWARAPDSTMRPALLARIHGHVKRGPAAEAFWRPFFARGLTDTGHPYYSHLPRWRNGAFLLGFFADAIREQFDADANVRAPLDAFVDPDLARWHPLSRAQYLESVLFLPGNLLSSQGDRMLLGHGVEGRFPFLDHRVIELGAALPPEHKLRGLDEKYLLKRVAAPLLPRDVTRRTKQPYRAPIVACFVSGDDAHEESLLGNEAVRRTGLFDPARVAALVAKASRAVAAGVGLSEREGMAVCAIASLQLLHHHFLSAGAGASVPATLPLTSGQYPAP